MIIEPIESFRTLIAKSRILPKLAENGSDRRGVCACVCVCVCVCVCIGEHLDPSSTQFPCEMNNRNTLPVENCCAKLPD